MTFLVALDTGSDLFWVPCDCKQCAPTTSPDYGNVSFNIYSPNASSTSKKVLCSNGLCDHQNRTSCTAAASNCPYVVQYVSANTSSSGILVEDILYLMTEDAAPQIVKAPIIFGYCCLHFKSFQFIRNPYSCLFLPMLNILWLTSADVEKFKLALS
ncbi:hypothetical protein BHE74_00015427 [Ensete ventricosum]|nr:hypothetical protein BHE74_00015427 [Ensete ventricosum]